MESGMDPLANLEEQKRLHARHIAWFKAEPGVTWEQSDYDRWFDLRRAFRECSMSASIDTTGLGFNPRF
jgi:hypothetical protein